MELEPLFCKCDHSKGYHPKRKPCEYEGCSCKRYSGSRNRFPRNQRFADIVMCVSAMIVGLSFFFFTEDMFVGTFEGLQDYFVKPIQLLSMLGLISSTVILPYALITRNKFDMPERRKIKAIRDPIPKNSTAQEAYEAGKIFFLIVLIVFIVVTSVFALTFLAMLEDCIGDDTCPFNSPFTQEEISILGWGILILSTTLVVLSVFFIGLSKPDFSFFNYFKKEQ